MMLLGGGIARRRRRRHRVPPRRLLHLRQLRSQRCRRLLRALPFSQLSLRRRI